MSADFSVLSHEFRQAAFAQNFISEPITDEIPAFTRKASGPVVLLSSGIHGDEPAGYLAALRFLQNGPPSDFHWLLTPLLNPSGIALGTREDASGRDLNRDYFQPKSPDITAHLQWLERQPVPDLFLSLHEDYDASGFYLYEIQTNGLESIHSQIFEKVQAHLPLELGPLIDGRESTADGWFFKEELPDIAEFVAEEGGLPEAIFLSQKGCPLSLTFETPTHQAPLETRISAHLAAIEGALSTFPPM